MNHQVGMAAADGFTSAKGLLGEMGRHLFDSLSDALRQELSRLIPNLRETEGAGRDEQRSYMGLDWVVREWLPGWLDLSPACREDATKIRALEPIVDLASADRAGPLVRQARATASAAFITTRNAALPTGAAAARAWDADRAAAWNPGWQVGNAAGRFATPVVARAADRAAVFDAAWSGARTADETALQIAIERIQRSAIDLYIRMVRLGAVAC